MTQVTATYELSEDAFLQGCYQLWAHRAVGRTGNYIVAAAIVALAVFYMVQGGPGWWGPGLLIGVAIFVALDRGRDRIWRRYYRSAVKYTAPVTAILSDDGVGVISAEGENTVPWSGFRTYVITRDYMILLMDQRRFSLIPRAAFATPQDHAMAEQLLVKHLPRLKARLL